jgi:hypothetical protein
LDNSFVSYFPIRFYGLNSIIFQAQAYGQLCVMLTIFGLMSLGNSYNIGKWRLRFGYILIPLLMFALSPNITAAIIFGAIIFLVLFIKLQLKMESLVKIGALLIGFIIAIAMIYLSGFGVASKYQSDEIYNLFLKEQLSFVLNSSLKDHVIGVDLDEYYKEAPFFEIAFFSYTSVAGWIFTLINLSIVASYMKRFFTSLKSNRLTSKLNNQGLEMACMNMLIVISMILSLMHFPVFTSYLGGLLFMFHFAFGLYLLRNQREAVLDSPTRVSVT